MALKRCWLNKEQGYLFVYNTTLAGLTKNPLVFKLLYINIVFTSLVKGDVKVEF